MSPKRHQESDFEPPPSFARESALASKNPELLNLSRSGAPVTVWLRNDEREHPGTPYLVSNTERSRKTTRPATGAGNWFAPANRTLVTPLRPLSTRRPCVHQDAGPFAWLDMSSAKVSRPPQVNVRMRPTDVCHPCFKERAPYASLVPVAAREVALAGGSGGWSVHAALPAVACPRTLFLGRVLPEREVGRAAPRAPCRPSPCPPVLSHKKPMTRSQDRFGQTPRERDPTYLDPDAFRLQGPSPGRPPGSSFAAAPGALMRFALPSPRAPLR